MSAKPPADESLEIAADREVVFDGFRPLTRYRFDVPRIDGTTQRQERFVYEIGHVVAILPYDPVRDLFVLIRQFRLGAHLTGGGGEMIEIPAGLVDDGENHEEAAYRELKEETHLEAASIHHALDFVPSPGFVVERGHMFFAEVDASNLPEETGVISETEVIRPFAIAPEAALSALDEGRIRNGYLTIALLWFARHRAELTGKHK